MSSLNTVAIQAAALDLPFEIPYTGPYSWLYAGEAAAAFIAAISQDGAGAPVFNVNGRCEMIEDGLSILHRMNNDAITATGDPFPFPTDLSETPLRAHVPDYPLIILENGIKDTYRAFKELSAKGQLTELPG